MVEGFSLIKSQLSYVNKLYLKRVQLEEYPISILKKIKRNIE